METGADYYSFDSDLTHNEMFISPDGHVFVYYADAKGSDWEDEIYCHYELPDYREMSNEDIVSSLNALRVYRTPI